MLSSCYAAKQAYYQGNLLATRQRISYLLWRQDTPPALKKKFETLNHILDFARAEGLNVGGAYRDYIETPHKDGVSYIVQAAPPLVMELKTWWFPLVGDVPYLGFYHKADRDELASDLGKEGFDVSRGEAEAFSSLGWFDDPVFSTMLERPEDSLAHLMLHELTHRTLWIPGHAEFNENLAEYVGIDLARRYLDENDKTDLRRHLDAKLKDRALFAEWIKHLKESLAAIYKENISDAEKVKKKVASIKLATTDGFPSFVDDGYRRLRAKDWNNASVLASSMYLPDLAPFEAAYKCQKRVRMSAFLKDLEAAYEKSKNPTKALADLCPQGRLSAGPFKGRAWKSRNYLAQKK